MFFDNSERVQIKELFKWNKNQLEYGKFKKKEKKRKNIE